MIDFTANFITLLICNDIPDCDDIDNAFSKRLRCVNFPTLEILKWTNQYQENTDLYLLFINENTEENKEGHIHCTTLYDTFKYWFKNNNPNSKIPSNKEFINNLKKYKNVCKVYVDNKSQLGIKNLQLIN